MFDQWSMLYMFFKHIRVSRYYKGPLWSGYQILTDVLNDVTADNIEISKVVVNVNTKI